MRGSVALCLALASLVACLHASSPAPQQQQPQWSGERRSWSRTKRQIAEVVRLYNELSKENQDERQEALSKIREIVNRVFVPANATSSTMTTMTDVVPGSNVTSTTEGDSSTTTSSTSRPPPQVDRMELLANLRRNLRGLGRLFMRELRTALTVSSG